jgi:AcrR family transcriptional regulator
MEQSVARRQPPDVRRQQILDGAERVLVRRGLDETTMSHVADEAGVAKGTVYLYFASKAELLAELRTRYLARMLDAMDAGAGGGIAVRLDRFIDALFSFSVANHRLHHVLFHEAGYSEADAFAETRRVLGAVVVDGVAGGELRVEDPVAATTFALHGLHGLLVEALHSTRPGQRRAAEVAKDLARRSLGFS